MSHDEKRETSLGKNLFSGKVPLPQCTLAGPMFCLAFINSHNLPQGPCKTMYANDITCTIPVSCSTDESIQPAVEWGINWGREYRMTLNLDKTKAMLIKLSPYISVPTAFSPVQSFTEWKFLGVVIDRFLSFNSHVAYVEEKAQKQFFSLLQLKRISVATEKTSLFYIYLHIFAVIWPTVFLPSFN